MVCSYNPTWFGAGFVHRLSLLHRSPQNHLRTGMSPPDSCARFRLSATSNPIENVFAQSNPPYLVLLVSTAMQGDYEALIPITQLDGRNTAILVVRTEISHEA
jgi:hypothetical protein